MTNSSPQAGHIKFRLKLRQHDDVPFSSENLWGRWLDETSGLVLAENNANEVPLVVDDVVRVVRDPDGLRQVVELVRLAESVVTYTSFGPPVTTEAALAVYDGWVDAGRAVFTEGGRGVMVTAWRELLSLDDVLATLAPTFVEPGWSLWEALTPEERYAELEYRLDLTLDHPPGVPG